MNIFEKFFLKFKGYQMSKKLMKKGSLKLVNRYHSANSLAYNKKIEALITKLIMRRDIQVEALEEMKSGLENYIQNVKKIGDKCNITTNPEHVETQKSQDKDIAFTLAQIQRLQTRIDQMT